MFCSNNIKKNISEEFTDNLTVFTDSFRTKIKPTNNLLTKYLLLLLTLT